MTLTNRERQTLYRQRARQAKSAVKPLLSAVEEAVQPIEQAMSLEREHGTQPNDGSASGKLLAEQEAWVAYHRRRLRNAAEEANSFYDPTRKTQPTNRT